MKILLIIAMMLGLFLPTTPIMAEDNSDVISVVLLDQEEEEEQTEEEEEYNYEEDLNAEEDEYEYDTVPEHMKLYKDKYEEFYDESFEVVWAATLEAVNELGCQIAREAYSQNEEGLYKGIIRTDMCVFTKGSDSTYDVLQKYSKEMPFIRGGIWENGRMQYKFVVKELADGRVHLLQKSELSGFEDNITHRVHFWESNGILETRIMTRIDNKIKGEAE